MTVNINNQEIELKKISFKTLLLYENLRDMAFQPKTLTDVLWLFYACCIAHGLEKVMSFEDFVAWLDEENNINKLTEFSDWLVTTTKLNKSLENKNLPEVSEKEIIETKKK